ncbi:hypothetical protein F444_01164 [Phytophthora nicotianae P1976]|uniref:ZSWIM1/3 RNaseH-like domain-containing protein n=1 Tax=Phytophthora nicotianae P1976 TaxID=1317066 RepID=A0A081B1K1_PHYNI|nr:hypothetical protein F444_01164 [Phytophthora nicotianae P1976]
MDPPAPGPVGTEATSCQPPTQLTVTGKRKATCDEAYTTADNAATSRNITGSTDTGDNRLNVGSDMQRRSFSSWQAFEAYLSEYEGLTFQVMAKVQTAVARNKAIDCENSSARLIPLEWKFYAKTYECTHAGIYQARGEGKRSRQESRALDCKAQFILCVRCNGQNGEFTLCVTKTTLVHNHALSLRTFQHYPSTRLAIPNEVMDTVDVLQRSGEKSKRLLKYIRENSSCKVVGRDVHNLVARRKASESGSSTVADRLHKWVAEFANEPGNIGRVFVSTVTEKTRAMREMFKRFPEVLLIDVTHGTNVSKYKVFSFMTHDAFGHGQYVQHAVVQNEGYETLLTAIETFKKHNPDWTKVYLHEEIAHSEYGFTTWQKELLRSVICMLVYATTERAYHRHRAYLRFWVNLGSAGTEPSSTQPRHPFDVYCTNNWDNCTGMWCTYERQNVVTLGNDTNNRLESSWKQLKDVVDTFMTVDECVAAMMCYQTQMEDWFLAQAFKLSVVQHVNYDDEMNHVANVVSEYACGLIETQYDFAVKRAAYSYNEDLSGLSVV